MSAEDEHNEQQLIQPVYQNVRDIKLQEAEEADLKVWVEEGEDPTEKVCQQLERNNWWLNAHWQEKGLPQEEFIWQMGDKKISIFNFGQTLTDQNVQDFKLALDSIAANTQYGLEGLEYILIDNTDKAHNYAEEGQLVRGESITPQRSIVLYPTVITEQSYRDGQLGENISGIQGIIPHEIGHQFGYNSAGENNQLVVNLWNNDYGFGRYNEEKGDFEVTNPSETVSDYARLNPSDDLCESLVAAIYNPGRLQAVSPKKLEFMRKLILKDGQAESAISKVDIHLPVVESPCKYQKKVKQKPLEGAGAIKI